MPFLNPLRTPFALMLLLAAFAVRAGNDYPLVLVHGFTGWGRDELLGFRGRIARLQVLGWFR